MDENFFTNKNPNILNWFLVISLDITIKILNRQNFF